MLKLEYLFFILVRNHTLGNIEQILPVLFFIHGMKFDNPKSPY